MNSLDDDHLFTVTLNHQPWSLLHLPSNVHKMTTIQNEIFRPLSKALLRLFVIAIRIHSSCQVLFGGCEGIPSRYFQPYQN